MIVPSETPMNTVCLKRLQLSELREAIISFKTNYCNEIDIDITLKKLSQCAETIGAYLEDERLGYIAYYRNDYSTLTGYISLLAVEPQYRNRHIASMLLNEAICDCKANGFEKIRLEVLDDNAKAIKLYNKFGFKFEKSTVGGKTYMLLLL